MSARDKAEAYANIDHLPVKNNEDSLKWLIARNGFSNGWSAALKEVMDSIKGHNIGTEYILVKDCEKIVKALEK